MERSFQLIQVGEGLQYKTVDAPREQTLRLAGEQVDCFLPAGRAERLDPDSQGAEGDENAGSLTGLPRQRCRRAVDLLGLLRQAVARQLERDVRQSLGDP